MKATRRDFIKAATVISGLMTTGVPAMAVAETKPLPGLLRWELRVLTRESNGYFLNLSRNVLGVMPQCWRNFRLK